MQAQKRVGPILSRAVADSTIKTSNSSSARNGFSMASHMAARNEMVEKDRSPPESWMAARAFFLSAARTRMCSFSFS